MNIISVHERRENCLRHTEHTRVHISNKYNKMSDASTKDPVDR